MLLVFGELYIKTIQNKHLQSSFFFFFFFCCFVRSIIEFISKSFFKAIWGEGYELSKYEHQILDEYYRGNLSSVGMLRDGDYCLGQTQVADARSFSDIEEIDKHRISMSDFYRSKYFKAISENGFDCGNFSEKHQSTESVSPYQR